jgi:dihydroorotate dehydrogenase/Pyruvate/2-oxoacid:ferredoxin oxidoreductase delta subunit
MPGCAGITATSYPIEKWLRAGAGGIVGKSLTYDPLLRQTIRPIFYPLNKCGLKGAMTESELLNPLPPETWAEKEAPKIRELCRRHNARWIQSIVGKGLDAESWAKLGRLVEDSGADAVELDLGCPLAQGQSKAYETIELGEEPVYSSMLVNAVKKAVDIPVGAKLSPTIRRLDKLALALQASGVDYFSAVNVPAGFAIDVEKEEIMGANTFVAYIPGPSLKWWGLWKVAQISQVCNVPISGIGGIWNGSDAIEYILMGCPTVQIVSSVYFKGAAVFSEILDGIRRFMEGKGYGSIDDFKGKCLRQIKTYREIPKEKKWDIYPKYQEEVSPIRPTFNLHKCNFCMLCTQSCIVDAIQIQREQKKIDVDMRKCYGCGFCCGICPRDAVELFNTKTGRTVWTGRGKLKA